MLDKAGLIWKGKVAKDKVEGKWLPVLVELTIDTGAMGDGKYLTLGSLMKHWTCGLIDQLTPDTIAQALLWGCQFSLSHHHGFVAGSVPQLSMLVVVQIIVAMNAS